MRRTQNIRGEGDMRGDGIKRTAAEICGQPNRINDVSEIRVRHCRKIARSGQYVVTKLSEPSNEMAAYQAGCAKDGVFHDRSPSTRKGFPP